MKIKKNIIGLLAFLVFVLGGSYVYLMNQKAGIKEDTEAQTVVKNSEDMKESKVLTGRYFGYIKGVNEVGGIFHLSFDLAEWDVNCSEEECPTIGYRIINEDNTLVSLPISSDAHVEVQTYSQNQADGNFNYGQVISLSEFLQIVKAPPRLYPVTQLPFWIELRENKILEISEQYIP